MTFSEVNQKLKELMGVRQNYKVAEQLGLGRTAFQERKKRGRIPWEEIIEWCKSNSVSFDNNFSKLEGTSLAGTESGQIHPSGGTAMRIPALLVAAERVLKSPSPFANALAQNIDTFAVGLDLWEKKEAHHPIPKGQEVKT